MLQPITTLIPPAPEELLNSIFCNCTKGCGSNCGCRKVGLQCSVVCGSCRGQSCLNTTPDDTIVESEFNEDEPDLIYLFSDEITVNEDEDDAEAEIEEIDDEEEEEVSEDDE